METSLTVIPDSGLGVDSLLARAIDAKLPVEQMERLLAMRRELKAESARDAFFASLSAFQAACPVIVKDKAVMNKDGRTVRYRYAPLDSIVRQVGPLLKDHGFSHRETAKVEGDWVTAICTLHHELGHKEDSEFKVPIDKEAFMAEAQKFASALTFTKRYAFCNALGILTGDEDDDATTTAKTPQDAPTPPQASLVLPAAKTPPGPTPQPAKAIPANSPKPNPAAIEAWLNMHKTKLIALLAPNRDAALDYGKAAGILLPGDDLEDGSVTNWFPGIDWSRPIADNEAVVAAAKQRHLAGVAAMMDGHQIPDPAAPPRKIVLPAAKPAITACPHCNHSGLKPDGEYVGMTICQFCGWRFDESGKCWEAHPWQYVLCPVPPKGASKKEYDKHPITLGQMERTDNKRAFGMVMNFSAEPREWKGKIYQPSAADIKFAQACEQARAHLQKPTHVEQMNPAEDEPPF